jgi:hypothetical protein
VTIVALVVGVAGGGVGAGVGALAGLRGAAVVVVVVLRVERFAAASATQTRRRRCLDTTTWQRRDATRWVACRPLAALPEAASASEVPAPHAQASASSSTQVSARTPVVELLAGRRLTTQLLGRSAGPLAWRGAIWTNGRTRTPACGAGYDRAMHSLGQRISEQAAAPYRAGSLSARTRARRWQRLAETFPEIAEMTVLDVGGDARAWRTSPVRPAHVTLLNIFAQAPEEPWMSAIAGDACALPDDLPRVDLVYSNSVIEHVGGHWRRERFAEGIRASAPRYWVQTPYRYFPVEPHFLFPGLQHLPRRVQAEALRRWPLASGRDVTDREQALSQVLEIDLLSTAEMRAYFPDATLERERFGGLVKSLIAIRSEPAP